jgi:site-specific DNA-methyltransferase (adenine-specific)
VPVCRHCGGDIKSYGGHPDKLHPDGIDLSDGWYDMAPVRHRTTKRRSANDLSEKLLERVLRRGDS